MLNYDVVGDKIKWWGKFLFVLETVAAVVLGIFLLTSPLQWCKIVGVVIMILIPIYAWVQYRLLYGFGKIVNAASACIFDRISNSDKTSNISPAGSGENRSDAVDKPQNAPPKIAPAQSAQYYRSCPRCGEIVTSSICSTCGKTNNLFD